MMKACSENFRIQRFLFNKYIKSGSPLFITLLMLGSLLLLGSCMSMGAEKFDTAPLLGMVYDMDNLPCKAASILLDGWEKCQTDVNGRFIVPDVAFGKHIVSVKKPGLEPLAVPLNYVDRKAILYLKVTSIKQILEKAEDAISQKKIDVAEKLLARAQAIDPVNPVYIYMSSLLLIKQQKFEEASKLLEQLVTLGYKESVIYLTMADLYEYRLQNYEKAALALDIYVKMRPLPEVKQRLAELVATHNLADVLKKNAQNSPTSTPAPTLAPITTPTVPEGNSTDQPVNNPNP